MTRIVKLRQDKEHPEVFWVKSSNREATYRVQLYEDGSVTCDCTHGLNNPGRAHCYHAEAAGKLKRRKEGSMSEQALPNRFIKEPVQRGIEDGVQWAVYPAPRYGAVNGYVYVPEGHPGHGKDYDDEVFDAVNVHGGLTFSEEGWIGFDTLHSSDWWPEMPPEYDFMKGEGCIHWTTDMVVEETKNLARQIAEGVRDDHA